jgi:hypothetical protein
VLGVAGAAGATGTLGAAGAAEAVIAAGCCFADSQPTNEIAVSTARTIPNDSCVNDFEIFISSVSSDSIFQTCCHRVHNSKKEHMDYYTPASIQTELPKTTGKVCVSGVILE